VLGLFRSLAGKMALPRPDTDYQPLAVLGGGAIGLAERIALISLRPGSVLSTGLFTLHGVKLLPPRAQLTDEIFRALLAMDQPEFILARDLNDLATLIELTPSHVPAPGAMARADLLTVGGMMALEPNQLVEQHHADALQLGAFVPAADAASEPTSVAGTRAVRTAMLSVAWPGAICSMRIASACAVRSRCHMACAVALASACGSVGTTGLGLVILGSVMQTSSGVAGLLNAR
jgi:hypothetical protein